MADEVVAFPGPVTAHIDDVASLRLPQNFDNVPTDRVVAAIKVGRPGKQEFFRAHPGGAYRGDFGLLLVEEDREFYVVVPSLHAELGPVLRRMTLVATSTATAPSDCGRLGCRTSRPAEITLGLCPPAPWPRSRGRPGFAWSTPTTITTPSRQRGNTASPSGRA